MSGNVLFLFYVELTHLSLHLKEGRSYVSCLLGPFGLPVFVVDAQSCTFDMTSGNKAEFSGKVLL